MHEVSEASNPDILMQLTARQDLIIRIPTVKAMKCSGCLLLETSPNCIDACHGGKSMSSAWQRLDGLLFRCQLTAWIQKTI